MEDNNLPEDPIVMYIIINETLGMSLGKTCAQVGHAVQMLMQEYSSLKSTSDMGSIDYTGSIGLTTEDYAKLELINNWLETSYTKITLKADLKEWEKIKLEYKDSMYLVKDKGLTEILPGSETVIGLFPMKKSERSKTLKRLQALK